MLSNTGWHEKTSRTFAWRSKMFAHYIRAFLLIHFTYSVASVATWSGSGLRSPQPMIWPTYLTWLWANLHFFRFSVKPHCLISLRNSSKSAKWWSNSFEYTEMSSTKWGCEFSYRIQILLYGFHKPVPTALLAKWSSSILIETAVPNKSCQPLMFGFYSQLVVSRFCCKQLCTVLDLPLN